jgi:putative ABC transport system ATP-binding protein
MSAAARAPATARGFDRGNSRGALRTVARGLRATPGVRQGLVLTLLLGLVATAGRVVPPVAVQRVVDDALLAPGGPDVAAVTWPLAGAAVAVVLAGLAGYGMFTRLVRVTESALYDLRVAAFRRLHDLSILHQAEEQRGSLVSRVTGDVDRISRFLQWGGVTLLINTAQLVLALVVMAWYSVPLTLLVLAVFVPLVLVLRAGLPRVVALHRAERQAMGRLLARLAESVVGAEAIRAFGAEDRTDNRLHEAAAEHERAYFRAGRMAALLFSSGETVAAAASAAAAVGGVLLGLGGGITAGELLAFLFLVSLFVSPVQVATEVLNQAQTAVAGWGRVLDLLEAEPDVVDPAPQGPTAPAPAADGRPPAVLPDRRVALEIDDAGFTYPDGTVALAGVTAELPPGCHVAVVGETGSGKTTLAKLVARLMDPGTGTVALDGVPLHRVPFAELRRRVVMVPQDGFLFDDTVAGNIARGRPGADRTDTDAALAALGLSEWATSLPGGVDTPVGERGAALSGGERQLVALARAFVADPDLLVLDEATSAIDPATEARLQAALTRLVEGRSALIIAHRLSTAEQCDEVWVFDGGRLVQRGSHEALVAEPGRYRELVDSWRGAWVRGDHSSTGLSGRQAG